MFSDDKSYGLSIRVCLYLDRDNWLQTDALADSAHRQPKLQL